jgi:hypothetical protein
MMDEQVVFERFHEALDLEPRPGAYERFRADFMNPSVAAMRRPVFQLRFSNMGLRIAAALAVVAIASALVAGYVATHRSTSQVPATHTQNVTTSPASQSSPAAHSSMDPAVVVPSEFPSDFPVYPGARPTFVGGDSSFGFTIFTINWETTDSIDQGYAWYQTALGQGDWTITSKTAGANGDSISFARKSKPSCTGDVVISQRYPGVTQIDVTVCG